MSSLQQLQAQKTIAQQQYQAGTFPKGNYASQQAAYQAWVANQDRLIADAQAKQVDEKPTVAYSRTQEPHEFSEAEKAQIQSTWREIQAQPKTEEEARALGKSSYVPESARQEWLKQAGNYLAQKDTRLTYYKDVPVAQPVSNDLTQGAFYNFQGLAIQNPITGNVEYSSQQEIATKLVTVSSLLIGGPLLGGVSKLGLSGAKAVATQAGVGAGLNVGFSQVAKSVQGGGLLTAEEAVIAGATGAILVPVGAKAISALKLTGDTLAPSLGRIGVSTGIGAGVGGGVEYVTTGKVTAENVLVGAGTGAAFGVAGEALPFVARGTARTLSKTSSGKTVVNALSNFKDNVVGSKFVEVTGMKEVSSQNVLGKEVVLTRISQPVIKTVRLRGEEARLYKQQNLGTMKNPVIEFEGTQRIKIVQKDAAGVFEEVTTFPKAAPKKVEGTAKFDVVGDINKEFSVIESVKFKGGDLPLLRDSTVVTSTRSVKPILSAIKNEQRIISKTGPVSEAQMFITKGKVQLEKSVIPFKGIDKPITVLKKSSIVSDKQFLPAQTSVARQLKTVRVYDKPLKTGDVLARATGKPKRVAESPELFERVTGKLSDEINVKPKVSGDPPLVVSEQIKILREQANTQKLMDKALVDKAAMMRKEMGDYSGAMKPGTNEYFRNLAKKGEAAKGSGESTSSSVVSTEQEIIKEAVGVDSALSRAIVGEAKSHASIIMPPPTRVTQKPSQVGITAEDVYISYPGQSPLAQPKAVSIPKEDQKGIVGVYGLVGTLQPVDTGIVPREDSAVKAIESVATVQGLKPIEVVAEKPVVALASLTPVSSKYRLPVGAPWGAGGSGDSRRGPRGFGGRFFKLRHKIPLPKQLYGQVLGKRRNSVLSQVKSKPKKGKRRRKKK